MRLLAMVFYIEDHEAEVQQLYKQFNFEQFKPTGEGSLALESNMLDNSSPRARALAPDNSFQQYKHFAAHINFVQEYFKKPQFAGVDVGKISHIDLEGTNIKKQ